MRSSSKSLRSILVNLRTLETKGVLRPGTVQQVQKILSETTPRLSRKEGLALVSEICRRFVVKLEIDAVLR